MKIIGTIGLGYFTKLERGITRAKGEDAPEVMLLNFVILLLTLRGLYKMWAAVSLDDTLC